MTAGHHHHGIGEEPPHSHLMQGASAAVFAAVWVLDSFVLGSSTLQVALPVRLGLSLTALAAALYLVKSSHDVVFGGEAKLTTAGVYARVRNPMYLGALLLYSSFIFLTMSLISFIPLLAAFYVYDSIAAYEERDLERMLGQEYVDYKKRVRRWIPFPKTLKYDLRG